MTMTKTDLHKRREQLGREQRELAIAEARQRAEGELAAIRRDEHAAALDKIDAYVQEQNEREYREFVAGRERLEQRRRELAELDAWTPPRAPMTRAEAQAGLGELGSYLDRVEMAERERLTRQTDAALSRRLHDWTFRRSWDARHPGGVDRCGCESCTAYRETRGGGMPV